MQFSCCCKIVLVQIATLIRHSPLYIFVYTFPPEIFFTLYSWQVHSDTFPRIMGEGLTTFTFLQFDKPEFEARFVCRWREGQAEGSLK